MKKQIVNYIVLIVIAIAANYPIYKNLQESVKAAQSTVDKATAIVGTFNSKLDSLENDILSLYVRGDILKTNLESEIDSTLNKITSLKLQTTLIKQETDSLNSKISKAFTKSVNKAIETKIVPGLPGFK